MLMSSVNFKGGKHVEAIDFTGILPVWHLVVRLGSCSQPPSLTHVRWDPATHVLWLWLHLHSYDVDQGISYWT